MNKTLQIVSVAALWLATSAGCINPSGTAEDPDDGEPPTTVARVWGHAGSFVSYGNKCLDIRNNGTADRTPVQLYDCNGTSAQKWNSPQFEWDTIASSGPSYAVLDAPFTTDFSTTWIFQPWGGANQQWTIPGMEIRGVGDKCVDVPFTTDGSIAWMFTCWGGANQRWTFNRTTGEVKTSDGRCLAATGHANNTSILVRTCNGGVDQHWYLETDGRLAIAGGYCLDVPDGNTADRTPLQLYQCSGTFSGAHSFYFRGAILGLQSQKCLQVHHTSSGYDTYNGSLPELSTCNGDVGQQWGFHWD